MEITLINCKVHPGKKYSIADSVTIGESMPNYSGYEPYHIFFTSRNGHVLLKDNKCNISNLYNKQLEAI